jgi:serine phosphatase RsbU (regulator of sigma subunit)
VGVATRAVPAGDIPSEPEGMAAAPEPMPNAGSARAWRPARVAIAAFLVGLAVTGALALTSHAVYDRNEGRLLNLRVRELGLVLTGSVPGIQTPLASAAALANATDGSAQRFRAFIAPYVGPGRQFASASLWPLAAARLAPAAVVGIAPALASLPQRATRFFRHADRSTLLSVTGILAPAEPRLGYEFNTPGVTGGFAVYAESLLPKDRRSRLSRNSAFADLNYALYLGRSRRPRDLLVTSLKTFPIQGRQASEVVPFGDNVFTLVVTPNGALGGTFFQSLPWVIAGLGLLLSLLAGGMTDRLARGRRHAEQLAVVLDRVADENRRLYTEQRSIAQALQQALLPEALPEFSGVQTSARYVPAAAGIDVGGDWYDLAAAGAGCVFLVIGDVSGHGLRAATTMASVRYATLAYAAQGHRPGVVLANLSRFVNDQQPDYFVTVLCALIDVEGHQITLASAGHLAPLLLDGENSRFVEINVGLPVGVAPDSTYDEVTIPVPAKATLVAFTDGLVERRGEILDVGLARLQAAAGKRRLALEELVSALASELASEGHHDDTAILAVRWRS